MFSAAVWDHFHNARNRGLLDCPNREGWAGSMATGQFFRMQLEMEGNIVRKAGFQTYGCVPLIACGSYLTEWAQGRNQQEILVLEPAQIESALGGLPEDRRYCADMALEAMRRALAGPAS